MVHSLGEEYPNFAFSLILLKSLDKEELKAAFLAEETKRRRRPEGLGGDSALFTASGTYRCPPNVTCLFCEKVGHCTHKCPSFKHAKNYYKGHQERGKAGRNTNKASKMPSASPPAPTSSSTTPASSTTSPSTQKTPQSVQASEKTLWL